MNREVYHKTQNKKVVVLFNFNKELIGYHLETFTPNTKRTLRGYFTVNKNTAKQFLN